jgi:hypothetical protein
MIVICDCDQTCSKTGTCKNKELRIFLREKKKMDKKFKLEIDGVEKEVFSSDELQEVLDKALEESKKDKKKAFVVKESATNTVLSRFGVILG